MGVPVTRTTLADMLDKTSMYEYRVDGCLFFFLTMDLSLSRTKFSFFFSLYIYTIIASFITLWSSEAIFPRCDRALGLRS